MRVSAISQKLLKSGLTPSCGSIATAPAMKIGKSQGEHTAANLLSFSNPRIASAVNAIPMTIVISAQVALVGSTSVSSGVGTPIIELMAVAETEIIAPARMQYSSATATL